MKASVIGAGSFGTAVATVLASNCTEVRLWGRDAEVAAAINSKHENPRYLPGIQLPPNLRAVTELEPLLEGTDLLVCALPSQATRESVQRALQHLPAGVPIVTGSKGIENETLLTMTEVLESCLPEERHPYVAVLSGPSFAREMALKAPTAVTIAAQWERTAVRAQRFFGTETFRAYTSTDVVGVQLGGALKNVIAIAAGILEGLGLGHNPRAALITRGLAEITRLGVAMGADPLTFAGLAGMGDLIATCISPQSRNRYVGEQLGRGRGLAEILDEMKMVAEGVKTAETAVQLAERHGVEMPICSSIHDVITGQAETTDAYRGLLRGRPGHEAGPI
jgi:glycerol-3-phosphate dehydrogenase (NAD(P)+)